MIRRIVCSSTPSWRLQHRLLKALNSSLRSTTTGIRQVTNAASYHTKKATTSWQLPSLIPQQKAQQQFPRFAFFQSRFISSSRIAFASDSGSGSGSDNILKKGAAATSDNEENVDDNNDENLEEFLNEFQEEEEEEQVEAEDIEDHYLLNRPGPEPRERDRFTALVEEAYERFEEADYDKAIELYTKAIDHETSSSDAKNPLGVVGLFDVLIERGCAFLLTNQFERALSDFSRSIDLRPKDEVGYHNRGLAYKKLAGSSPDSEASNLRNAIADFTKAIEINPMGSSDSFRERASAHYDLAEFDKAIEDATKALELEHQYAMGKKKLKMMQQKNQQQQQHQQQQQQQQQQLQQQQQYGEQQTIGGGGSGSGGGGGGGGGGSGSSNPSEIPMEEDTEIVYDHLRIPAIISLFNMRGKAHMRLARWDRAHRDFDHAIRLDPADVHSHFNHGVALFQQYEQEASSGSSSDSHSKLLRDAIEYFNRAIDLNLKRPMVAQSFLLQFRGRVYAEMAMIISSTTSNAEQQQQQQQEYTELARADLQCVATLDPSAAEEMQCILDELAQAAAVAATTEKKKQ